MAASTNPLSLAGVLTVGLVLGSSGALTLKTSSVADGVDSNDVQLLEARTQFLADGGCAFLASSLHRPTSGLRVAADAREYPMSSDYCTRQRGVATDAGVTAPHETRAQFLADGGCASYVTHADGQTPEVGESSEFCFEQREKGARAAGVDFGKSSAGP